MNYRMLNRALQMWSVTAATLFFAANLSNADTAFVAWRNGDIEKFDLASRVSLGMVASAQQPSAMTADNYGNVYWSRGTAIYKYAPNGTTAVLGTIGFSASDIAVDSMGYVYAANSDGNSITKIAPDGASSLFCNTGLDRPRGLALDSAGNLYVGNYFGHEILKITSAGLRSLFGSVNHPGNMVFDHVGNLYVVSGGPGEHIRKFAPDGSSYVFASTGSFEDLTGALEIDSWGNLYASMRVYDGYMGYYEGTYRFAANGSHQGLTRDWMRLAIVVPEPSCCGMLVLGSLVWVGRRLRCRPRSSGEFNELNAGKS